MSFAESITVEALEADPYPIYAELRRSTPVAFVPAVNLWFVTRWKDVETVAKSPDIFSAVVGTSPVERSFGKPTILTTDGEIHKDLRQGIDPKYRPRKVAAYAGDLVRSIAEPYLDRIAEQGSAELMAEYFEPVSTLSLARSLGLTDIDMPTLRRWFHGLAQGAINFENDPKRQEIADAISAEVGDAILPTLERLARAPDDSALSHMLHDGMPEDRFDINRDEGNHAAFGFGHHFCSGRFFAREQMCLAVKLLLERFPDLSLVPGKEPVFRGWEFRAPTTLYVSLGANRP